MARALPRGRHPPPGPRAGPHPSPRATTSRHTRNGRSAACSTTTGPIAMPGRAAARSPAAASSSTPAGRPAEQSTRPVRGRGRVLSAHQSARRARRALGLASDPCGAAGAMTMPYPVTCPTVSRSSRSRLNTCVLVSFPPSSDTAEASRSHHPATPDDISGCGCRTWARRVESSEPRHPASEFSSCVA